MRRRFLLLSLPLVVAACASGSDEPAVTWHRDVAPLLAARCTSCHSTGGIAPFALDDYASAKAVAPLIKSVTASRIMPPWLASPGCTTYRGDESLSDAQIALLGKWADLGAPEGNAKDTPISQSAVDDPGLSRVDLTLPMPAPYTPNRAKPDDYRCFLLDWPSSTEKFVTGFRANPGNPRIVHHVIAYLITPDEVAKYQQLDANEPGEGYTCFGGPAPGARSINWLGAWAPGGRGNDNPAGTGIRVPAGSKVVLQVHYNLQNAKDGDTDVTSVDFKLDDHVDHEAFILPWTDPNWVGAFGPSTMTIPAGAPDAEHDFSHDPTEYMTYLTHGAIANGQPFRIHSAALHMHTLGTKASLDIVRGATQAPECLLDIAHWDFNWQRSYAFSEPKTLSPGDQLYIECHWDNTSAHQKYASEPQDVTWGEGTEDEMCLAILYVSKP